MINEGLIAPYSDAIIASHPPMMLRSNTYERTGGKESQEHIVCPQLQQSRPQSKEGTPGTCCRLYENLDATLHHPPTGASINQRG